MSKSMLSNYFQVIQSQNEKHNLPPPQFIPGQVVPLGGPEADSPQQLLMQVGDYQVIVDLQPEERVGVVGINLLRKREVPFPIGVFMPIPLYSGSRQFDEQGYEAVTLGPAYKDADGSWVSLAGIDPEWGEISWYVMKEVEEKIELQIEYEIAGGPTLQEYLHLTEKRLRYRTQVDWVIGGFRLQLPVLLTDGSQALEPKIQGHKLLIAKAGHQMVASSRNTNHYWELDEFKYVNSLGIFQNVYLQGRSEIEYEIDLTIQ